MSYRKKFAKRFACFVVAGVLVLGMVEPPRAKAVASAAALYQITATFLASCGLSWGVESMNGSGFTDEVGRLLQEYLDTEFAGQTPLEWSAGVACTLSGTGKLTIPKVLAEKMSQFAHWVVEKYQLVAGGNPAQVAAGAATATLTNGMTVTFSTFLSNQSGYVANGKLFMNVDIPAPYYEARFPCGAGFVRDDSKNWPMSAYLSPSIGSYFYGFSVPDAKEFVSFSLATDTNEIYLARGYFSSDDRPIVNIILGPLARLSELSITYPNIALNPAADIAIPNTGSMTEDEELAIGTGIAATTLDGLLAAILEAILAGNLDATQEIVKDEAGTGEATDEAIGDTTIEGIKKEQASLGAIFISKFPFSIPWDVYAAVKLLAAPPKTPRWEVDLLAPIEYRFGKFPGDTTIVIDMSEYPVVGHFCRWMSTFLFVWALMLGTKRLIWST